MTAPPVLVHTSLQTVRWGDMDALRHVNNTLYFRFMEQARSEWLYAQGDRGCDPGQDSVIVHASCDYLAPIVFPATVEVRMFLCDLGRASLGSTYEIWVGDRKCATGAAKLVWVDVASGRSSPLPARIAAPLRDARHAD
jgi:acyl-CoA thioester hydrolase